MQMHIVVVDGRERHLVTPDNNKEREFLKKHFELSTMTLEGALVDSGGDVIACYKFYEEK